MCVIAFKKIDNKNYIAKNRDKSKKTTVCIIHEIIDNIEIIYFYDVNTYWIEGMNEFGIGALNSTLAVKTDEIIDRSDYQKKLFKMKKNLLKNNNIEAFSLEWLSFSHKNDLSRHGHTLICDKNKCYHLESFDGEIPIKENIFEDSVYTNHSIKLKNKGYTYGDKYLSSLIRKEIAYNEIINIKNKDEILNTLNKNYIDINPQFHTYRNKRNSLENYNYESNVQLFSTTSQILLCLTDLKFYFNYDNENCNFKGYINKLPKNYIPKIQVYINKNIKLQNPEKLPFEIQYIDHIIEKYMFKKNTILIYLIILIFVLYTFIRIYDK